MHSSLEFAIRRSLLSRWFGRSATRRSHAGHRMDGGKSRSPKKHASRLETLEDRRLLSISETVPDFSSAPQTSDLQIAMQLAEA